MINPFQLKHQFDRVAVVLRALSAAFIIFVPAASVPAQPAAHADLRKHAQIPATCASDQPTARPACSRDLETQMKRISTFAATPHIRELAMLDQKAATAPLCDMVKVWADQSLDDLRVVWRYLEHNEADWTPSMRDRITPVVKEKIGPRLATLRENAGLGKPCGWVAWGTFKTFAGKVAAGQQSAPDAAAEIADLLRVKLSRSPNDIDTIVASLAYLRALGNAAKSAARSSAAGRNFETHDSSTFGSGRA